MSTRKVKELIQTLKDVVDDEMSPENDRESCLKKLFKYDPDYAEEQLELYVERRRPWAIDMAIKIEERKDSVVGGVGIYE